MDVTTWAGFVLASTLLLVIPGPTVLFVVSSALGQGFRAAACLALGVVLGHFTTMTLFVAGLGALLAASATLFTVLKCAAAAYLVWLGLRLWRAEAVLRAEARADAARPLRMVERAWLVTALNPRSLTFFAAFLPHAPGPAGDLWTHLMILEATFLVLAFANALGYGLLAARAGRLAGSPRAVRGFHRTGAALMIGAGLWTVARA